MNEKYEPSILRAMYLLDKEDDSPFESIGEDCYGNVHLWMKDGRKYKVSIERYE